MINFLIKYTPRTFAELLYNDEKIDVIKSAIANEMYPLVILITAEFGLGKTVLAHLMAKSLLCENRKEGAWEPCCKCNSCSDPNYNFHSYVEIDCTRSPIEYHKRVYEYLNIYPLGKLWVLYFDEWQRAIPQAMDLALKEIEKNRRIAFIYSVAEDEYKKVDKALVQRAITVYLTPPAIGVLLNWLKGICKKEEIILSDAELEKMILLSSNVPRLCLQNLQKYYLKSKFKS